MTTGSSARRWLSERLRSGASLVGALLVVAVLVLVDLGPDVSPVDACVLGLLTNLAVYLGATIAAFSTATPAEIADWARRESRGTMLQRYVFGTAPGPGVSIFFAVAALAVALVWLPGRGGASLPDGVRVAVAVLLVVVGWVCVLVSFAVSFHADNLVEDEQALDFPGDGTALWSDYIYFAMACMTTFGTTDVDVTSRQMRRTVVANAVIAFVFNSVTVATVVSVLGSN